jgi:hypothetical protein
MLWTPIELNRGKVAERVGQRDCMPQSAKRVDVGQSRRSALTKLKLATIQARWAGEARLDGVVRHALSRGAEGGAVVLVVRARGDGGGWMVKCSKGGEMMEMREVMEMG